MSQSRNDSTSMKRTKTLPLERPIQYVFIDIVGFTKDRAIEDQVAIIDKLNSVVHSSLNLHKVGKTTKSRILIPTGDGICICLLGQVESDLHLKIATTIVKKIDSYNGAKSTKPFRKILIRVGVNQNSDFLIKDINGRSNVAGRGINEAQRLMDKSDGNNIIISRSVHDTVSNRDKYRGKFRAGQVILKHATEPIDVYQYIDNQCRGLNNNPPASFVANPNMPAPQMKEFHVGLRVKKFEHIRLTPNRSTPQHTSFHEIPLDGLDLRSISFRVNIKSSYVRFGIKLLDHGVSIFDKTSITRNDGSMLFHIGKEKNSSTISASVYKGKRLLNKDAHVLMLKGNEINVSLTINEANNTAKFLINNVQVFNKAIQPDTRHRVVLMAWGDGHEYEEYVISSLSLTLSQKL